MHLHYNLALFYKWLETEQSFFAAASNKYNVSTSGPILKSSFFGNVIPISSKTQKFNL